MGRIFLFLCWVLFAVAPVTAGPNSNGAIIVHTNDAYSYLSTSICSTSLGLPPTCADAITRTEKANGAVVWFLASFLAEASPSVAGIYFGVSFDAANLDPGTRHGICGPPGSVAIPDAGWPGNGAGNSVAFGTPRTGSTLFPFYYFEVDEFSGLPGPYLCSAINPLGGYAAFFDDALPPAQDDVARFGCVKWYQDGGNSCPESQPIGACCDIWGLCTMTAEASCQAPRIWHSDWTACLPNPCPNAPGACCDPVTGACIILVHENCLPPRTWHDDWLSCEPNPCPNAIGACCDLSTGGCVISTHPDCPSPGVWHDEWTSCLPNHCPQPVAACCIPNGACTLTSSEGCLPPGIWHGSWLACAPNPCPPPVPGPNAGGAIVVHTNDVYHYLSTTVCETSLGQPATCETANTRTNESAGAVVWFLAAFDPAAAPVVSQVVFGVSMDEANLDAATRLGPCGPLGTFDMPASGWPANDAGNTVVFGTTMSGSTLFRFYYFVIDEFSGSAGPYFCSAINPNLGFAGFFEEPGTSAIMDEVTQFGCVRWYAPGSNDCPGVPAIGACCFLDGHCETLSEQQCLASPGMDSWIGAGTTCLPNDPCAILMGACCSPSGACTVTTAAECQPPNFWLPDSAGCQPNPCTVPVRTERTTWGKIKASYR